ncbi:SpaH/EbpB family LPXTG-anchored major pilin [Corynebacterium sp. TAE3-ERU12]|uniref:SpaH/EbpB family LPXTG-anchored major pilin n=1 Tax=Corynebacterium sp. TAE3-ERU12 TaxID=2849491 RepID=UPI001C43FAD9|nr:SpaH/EbpB family LPXTG-anchored major pilin [Corynebacterium sp. TAE3-ERU12]MBV7294456.1 SpaH/EbpB family LPXTG-anchored major pilin [Corynebacterium sp. TAE3-ERU12]
MNKSQRTLRSVTFSAIAGLALATGTFAAPMAVAQGPTPTAQAPASAINFDAETSLTVHKQQLENGANASGTHTGEEMTGVPGETLAGATFRVTKVNQPYSNNAEVQAATKLTVEQAKQKLAGDGESITTNEQGVAEFTGLDVGVYLVEETAAPEGFKPAKPFLVFLPMTNNDRTGWNYDVHVYPKNTKTEDDVKEVNDNDVQAGEKITYTIKSAIPTVAEGDTMSKYVVTDRLDGLLLDVAASDVSVQVEGGEALTANDDYTVAIDDQGDTKVVTVTLTEAGREKLGKSGGTLVTTLTPTFKGVEGKDVDPNGGVSLKNEATTTHNNGDGSGDTTTPTNEVESVFGNLELKKTNEADEALQGAKFELYQCSDKDNLGDQVEVGGETVFVTDQAGMITVKGLRVADYKNGEQVTSGPMKYCFVETEAPEGYELLAEPVEVEFTQPQLASQGEGQEPSKTYTKNVVNIEDAGTRLPSTGGMGIGILAALGAIIVGVGAWLAKRNSSEA